MAKAEALFKRHQAEVKKIFEENGLGRATVSRDVIIGGTFMLYSACVIAEAIRNSMEEVS